jgi:preprotein translocase subunit Sec63
MYAEVLEPPHLRLEVKRQVREMRQFYRSKDKKVDKASKRHT